AKSNWIPSRIAVSTPGKLEGPEGCVVAPGTARNMEAFLGEWDCLNLCETIRTAVGATRPVFIINDALAQLAGAIVESGYLRTKEPPLIGYIGPGTGLGGGFAKISDGKINFFTDGHIFDIMLDREPEDIWSKPGPIMAEDVISGRGFFDLTGKSMKSVCENPTLYAHYQPILNMLGRYLAQLIKKIEAGHVVKIDGHPQWSDSEISAASAVRMWNIGGSIGTQPPASELILDILRKQCSDHTFRPIGDPITAAISGAVVAMGSLR
ncbi:hypothetical protein EBR96_08525, partial [bacterium]|nr:hypothetical protein [bacterium]